MLTLRANLKTLRAENPLALSPRTLIVGRNGAGKSAVTQAIEYALTGSVSDLMGRGIVKQTAALNTLAPPDCKLHAALTLPDGSTYINGEPGLDPDLVFPLRALREHLLGAPEAARRWLLARMGVDADRPLADLATAKAHVKQAHADVEALQARIAELGQDAQPITDAERLALTQVTGFTQAELETKRAVLARLHAQASEAINAVMAMTAPTTDTALAQAAQDLTRSYAAAAKAAQDYASRAGGGAPDMVQRQQILPQQTWGEISIYWQQVADGYGPMLVQSQAYTAALAKAQQLRAEYAALLEAYNEAAAHPRPDVAALQARIERWDTLTALRTQLAARSQAAVLAEAKVKQLQAHILSLLQEAAGRFNAAVSAFLNVSAQFELVLNDGEKTAFRWGLRRPDGRIDVALSGAEWMQVQLAMACVLTPTTYTGPVFLLAEDRAWDPASLANAMRVLTSAPERYWLILSSTVLPQAAVDGWTIIGPDGSLTPVLAASAVHASADPLSAAEQIGALVGLPQNTVLETTGFDAHLSELSAEIMDMQAGLLPPPPPTQGDEDFVPLPRVAWPDEDEPGDGDSDGAEEEDNATDEAPPEKKKRGRKPKDPAAATTDAPAEPKRRGRPLGSKNKPKGEAAEPPQAPAVIPLTADQGPVIPLTADQGPVIPLTVQSVQAPQQPQSAGVDLLKQALEHITATIQNLPDVPPVAAPPPVAAVPALPPALSLPPGLPPLP